MLVPETLIGRIELGQRTGLNFPALAPADAIGAVVSEIGPRAGRANAFPATLTLDRQHPDLRPGMTAEVVFRLAPPQPAKAVVFRIPVTAFHADGSQGHFVYKIDPESLRLIRTPVTVKDLAGDQALIEGPLKEGDLLVKTGLSFLHPDQQVRLMGRGVRAFNP